jgi:hypothetical protein
MRATGACSRALEGLQQLSHRRGVDRLLDWDAGRLHELRGDCRMLAIIPHCVILVQPQCRSRLGRELWDPLLPAGSEKVTFLIILAEIFFGARLNSRAWGTFWHLYQRY